MDKIKIDSFNDIFNLYRYLLTDQDRCDQNATIASNLSYLIDASAMATIIDFYNANPDIGVSGELWKSNLFVIRMYSVVTAEIVKYLEQIGAFNRNAFEEPNSLKQIENLRNKIHQFRHQDFGKNIKTIDDQMGRSRDEYMPRLDICLEYVSEPSGTVFLGTNIYQFHFDEAKEQSTVNLMQRIIRAVMNQPFLPSCNWTLRRSEIPVKYRWEVYCYTDITKNACLHNPRLIDRLLMILDDLSCAYEFFTYTLLIDSYLMDAPYIIYFLIKSLAIFLDETFDNLNQYIIHSEDMEDKSTLERVMCHVDEGVIAFCKTLRNNLHYKKQDSLHLGSDQELYQLLIQEIELVKNLLNETQEILNIKPSKARLTWYRFLRWVQMPSDRS